MQPKRTAIQSFPITARKSIWTEVKFSMLSMAKSFQRSLWITLDLMNCIIAMFTFSMKKSHTKDNIYAIAYYFGTIFVFYCSEHLKLKAITKAECISRGCPMLIKKRDKVTMLPYWVCGVTNQDVKKVHNCVNKPH